MWKPNNCISKYISMTKLLWRGEDKHLLRPFLYNHNVP